MKTHNFHLSTFINGGSGVNKRNLLLDYTCIHIQKCSTLWINQSIDIGWPKKWRVSFNICFGNNERDETSKQASNHYYYYYVVSFLAASARPACNWIAHCLCISFSFSTNSWNDGRSCGSLSCQISVLSLF